MASKNFRDILSEELNYYIVRVLRNSPISEKAVTKYLKTSLKEDLKTIKNHLEQLEEHQVICSFSHEENIYYLLLKDFYLLRRPPEDLIDYINRKHKIPEDVRKKYSVILKQYFGSYVSSLKKLKKDMEEGLIEVFINDYLQEVIEKLKEKPYTYKKAKKKLSNWDLVERILKKQNLIEILPSSQSQERWVLLKTDIVFQLFFPNYLIKNIKERLSEGKIEKELSLKSLYKLKKEYLKQEKPEQYDHLKRQAENKEKVIKRLLEKGKSPIDKAKKLVKIYKSLGEFEKREKLKIMIANEQNKN
ncbi:MAG: hypothetical protein R6U96_12305 [Promethearchaeia archaeon]